jgi:hypothetical protein
MHRSTYQPTLGEIECSAFNAAFHELGLRWHWDDQTYERLATEPCERNRVRGYLQQMQPHLLRAYDADFLIDAILDVKRRAQQALSAAPWRPVPRFDWSTMRAGECGF